jgi:septum formation protein
MMDDGSPQLILASTSRFRRRMLETAGLDFRVVPPDVDEPALRAVVKAKNANLGPSEVAEVLARAKAERVSSKEPDAFVLGADQVLALEGDMFEKPANLSQAHQHLLRLRGKSHQLHTAAAIATGGSTIWCHVEQVTLVMRDFSHQFLQRYLADVGPAICDTVGAYELDGPGVQLFERADGDYFTVIGLPLLHILAELRAHGVIAS